MDKSALQTKLKEVGDKVAGYASKETLTEAEIKDWESSLGVAETIKKQIEMLDKTNEFNAWAKAPAGGGLPAAGGQPGPQQTASQKGIVIAPRAIYGSVKNFKAEHVRTVQGESIHLTAEDKAYRFGMWFLGSVIGREQQLAGNPLIQKAQSYCRDNGLELKWFVDQQANVTIGLKAMSESVNTAGGFLVPPEFGNDMIVLREQYGVFRRNAKIVPMASDVRSDPRRRGGLTAYFVGENTLITESDKQWDRVQLIAKKLAVLTKMSTELNEDAIINLGDDLAGEIAYAFALMEDTCGFLGDGTSGYGGIVGLANSFLTLSATISQIAGLIVAANQTGGNGYGAITLNNFLAVQGRLPQYAAAKPGCKWICHRSFFYNTMLALALAAGGVTEAEILAAGNAQPYFLGHPVEFAQIMPSQFATSQICAYFGNLPLGVSFGDRRMTTIALSEHLNFDSDELAIRGTERFDINVHDVGNASGTASLQVAGPVVALITGAA